MQVGEWARFTKYSHYTDDKKTYVGIVEKGTSKSLKIKVNSKKFFFDNEVDVIKNSPNLVGLLEVGDIVHYITKSILNDKSEMIIDNIDRLNVVKESIKNGYIIITALELHENRVKQVIK